MPLLEHFQTCINALKYLDCDHGDESTNPRSPPFRYMLLDESTKNLASSVIKTLHDQVAILEVRSKHVLSSLELALPFAIERLTILFPARNPHKAFLRSLQILVLDLTYFQQINILVREAEHHHVDFHLYISHSLEYLLHITVHLLARLITTDSGKYTPGTQEYDVAVSQQIFTISKGFIAEPMLNASKGILDALNFAMPRELSQSIKDGARQYFHDRPFFAVRLLRMEEDILYAELRAEYQHMAKSQLAIHKPRQPSPVAQRSNLNFPKPTTDTGQYISPQRSLAKGPSEHKQEDRITTQCLAHFFAGTTFPLREWCIAQPTRVSHCHGADLLVVAMRRLAAFALGEGGNEDWNTQWREQKQGDGHGRRGSREGKDLDVLDEVVRFSKVVRTYLLSQPTLMESGKAV